MSFDAADGLTDELAAQIAAELDEGPADDTRACAAVRPSDAEQVELVLYDEDEGQPDVVVALSHAQAGALAAALLDAASEAEAD